MTGSLLSLVAKGTQDKYLIGNPKISFFRAVYKHHTNFSIYPEILHFDQEVDFGKKSSILIAKKGDLLHKMTLQIDIPSTDDEGISWINGFGHSIIEYIELEIGGHGIIKYDGTFLDLHQELYTDNSKINGYNQMIAKNNVFTRYTQSSSKTIYIPLKFWFTQDIGKSLPLVALQYADVRINLKLRPFSQAWYSGTSMSSTPTIKHITNANLHVDYILLAEDERKYFAQRDHEYLITQVQQSKENPVNVGSRADNYDLSFNHPCKEMYWVYQANSVSDTNDWLNYSNTLDNDLIVVNPEEPLDEITIKLDNKELFEKKKASYFRLVIPHNYFPRTSDKYIYVYTFGLYPDREQPSGSINFSMVDNLTFTATFPQNIKNGNLFIYVINYNVLRIKNGQAGILFSS